MKLRMQANSIRLRLKQREVDQLVQTGRVEEKIAFGSEGAFHYVLESSHAVPTLQATLRDTGILVQVPAKSVLHWASSDEVGIEVHQSAGHGEELQLLIEKDFACLNGSDAQNADTFPNPLAGAKC
jgi:hypothetical protein